MHQVFVHLTQDLENIRRVKKQSFISSNLSFISWMYAEHVKLF